MPLLASCTYYKLGGLTLTTDTAFASSYSFLSCSADVTYFVKHNSALDIEAQKRGTTFYLVDRRFDMLPSLLSSDLCSLHGQTDRLAVSAIWTFSSDLETVKSCWYGRTVIRNCAGNTGKELRKQLESSIHNWHLPVV